MSKLVNAIESRQTGRVKPYPVSFGVVVKEDLRGAPNAYLEAYKQYRLGVTLTVEGYAKEEIELTHLKEKCKRSIVEEVFGEFRSHFRRIERALMNLEIDEANDLLRQFENEMFS